MTLGESFYEQKTFSITKLNGDFNKIVLFAN